MEIQLSTRDFIPVDSTQTLSLNQSGYWFVMFRLSTCRVCEDIYPHFKQLMSAHDGIRFASVDMNQNAGNTDIVGKSRKTRTPIDKVPTFIFYSDGTPMVRYPTNNTLPSREGLQRAIVSGLQRAAEKPMEQQFIQNPVSSMTPRLQRGGGDQASMRQPTKSATLLQIDDRSVIPHNVPWKLK